MPATRTGKTYDIENDMICRKFNEHKTEEMFSIICDENPIYRTRNKCRCCGGEILYSNVVFAGAYQLHPKIYSGTSFLTTKEIYGKTYWLTVCEKCMEEKFPEFKEKNKSRIYNMPNKYTQFAFNIPDDVIQKKKTQLCVRSKESFIEKYGEEEGTKRWDSYVDKERKTKTFEYWHETKGMTREEYEEFNKKRACTVENFIARYGEEEGLAKWNEYVNRQRYTTTKEYFIKTYGEEEGEKKYNNFNNNRLNINCYSSISQECFNELMNIEMFRGHNVMYATHGGEKQIYTDDGDLYYLDFYDDDLKICIEFNGNKYHPKPGSYKPDDIFTNPFGESGFVKDMWDREQKRKEDLKKYNGIDMFVIWEDEYRNSKINSINKLLEEIKSNGNRCNKE